MKYTEYCCDLDEHGPEINHQYKNRDGVIKQWNDAGNDQPYTVGHVA